MSHLLESFDIKNWNAEPSESVQNKAVNALEAGKVLFFPHLSFPISEEEQPIYSPEMVDPKAKNISYSIQKDRLSGTLYQGDEAQILKAMIHRFATSTRNFLDALIPHYSPNLLQAKTSFRPVEISGRKSSYRKNDTLLHVDSFPSSPNKGERILRFFSNINPEGKPRVWRLGEPFEHVAAKMIPRVSRPLFGTARLLQLLGITKSYRTQYDHYMLKMHDKMKGDAHYQETVPQQEIRFPAGSSWMVFTDQVSHAAMSGQHVLEQTFNLPINGLNDPTTSPLHVLEKRLKRSLA